MRFSYMHMSFIIDLGIDGCIYPPCVSNELDQYLSEPLFSQCKIDAPAGGENFVYSSTYRHVRADLQMSICLIPNE